ncbi:MAG: response regulator [Acidobacteriota bacterium]
MAAQESKREIRILLVDDEAPIREMIATGLRGEGYRVGAASSGVDALAQADKIEPDLVVSDVMMPEMDGFQFFGEYSRRFPHRLTPFVFLSSLSDRYSMILGLDLGADDFLVKPIHLDILRAKVRSVIQKKTRYTTPTFYGDLTGFSFAKLLQFCKRRGLTGEVVVTSPTMHTRLQFRGGTLGLSTSEESADFLERLFNLTAGTFVIHAQPFDFRDLEQAAIALGADAAGGGGGAPRPMGRLSALRVENRLFQIQSEFSTHPQNQIVTTVTVDGRTVLTRTGYPPAGASREELERLIDTQHSAVEKETREKLNAETIRKMRLQESSREKFNALFDEGCERFREHDFTGALDAWENAHALDPLDETLVTSLKVVKRKLKLE